jgi:hypothetical protein
MSSRVQNVRLDVLPSVIRFTGLTALTLESHGHFQVTPACIAKLAPLQRLSTLVTTLWDPSHRPADLAEFAHLTSAPPHDKLEANPAIPCPACLPATLCLCQQTACDEHFFACFVQACRT